MTVRPGCEQPHTNEQLVIDLNTWDDGQSFDEWIRGLPPIRPKPDKNDEQADA